VVYLVDFSKYKQKEIPPEESKKKVEKLPKISEKIDSKPAKIVRLIESDLVPSAKLNLIKFLYPLLTGKSTTNKLKESMKKTVIEEISKF